MQKKWNIKQVRDVFPSMTILDNGQPRVYLDAPAGSQVAQRVIDRTNEVLIDQCANDAGLFSTSVTSEAMMFKAHKYAATFLGAKFDEIVFGLNTTSMFFSFAYVLSRDWKAGDEIVLSQMDHDANVATWLRMAEEKGVKVRWLEIDPEKHEYKYEMLDEIINSNTKLVACNHASNLLGTISDVKRIVAAGRAVGAITIVDAVQSAPHIPIDVKDIDCDILSCSAYKFFGPHAAMLYLRDELRDRLNPLKIRPAPNEMPWKFAPGTPSFEAQAGAMGAIEHFAWLGDEFGGASEDNSLRNKIVKGIKASQIYEDGLMRYFLKSAAEIPAMQIFGKTSLESIDERVPTFSFRIDNVSRDDIANAMAKENIFTWTGTYYAEEISKVYDIENEGGVNRIGLAHYNTIEDIDAFFKVLRKIIRS